MRIERSFAALTLWLVILLICSSSYAQTRVNSSGTGGINTIQGQVFTSTGRIIDTPMTVRLRSISYGELSVLTDHSGTFAFRNLSAGSYEVIVDAGDNFEASSEYVTIDPDILGPNQRPAPKYFSVPVYLRVKTAERQKNGVVNAKLAGLPKKAVEHYEKGIAKANDDKVAGAISEFSKAINIFPAFVSAHIALGTVYLKAGKLDQAIESLSTALGYEPKNFEAEVNYGIALLAKADYRGAEKALIEAAQLDQSTVTPHYYLGLLYIQEKKFDLAQNAMETAEQLKGSTSFPLLHRCLGGIYLAKNMNALAVKELETYLDLAPAAKDADRIRQTIADLRAQTN